MHINGGSLALSKIEKRKWPCHTEGDSFKEVVDGESEDNEESTSCRNDSVLCWQRNLPMAVPMALTSVTLR